MKIIYFTDPHGKAGNPSVRLDNFSETILNKFKYVGKYAEQIKAAAILIGGDLLDTPDVSQNFISELSYIIQNYPCETDVILGNHDIYGYNPETFLRTSLNISNKLNAFNRLGKEPKVVQNMLEGPIAAITGQDSYVHLDKPENIGDYADSKVIDGAVNIHMVHGMLVEKVWPQVKYCTTLEQVMEANPNADIILSGHEHTGYGIKIFYRSDGRKVIFCNPGSLARVTSSTGDLRKDVRMAVITIENGEYDIELVNLPLDIARPANEVIDWERVALEKANKEKLQNLLTNISKPELATDLNYFEALNQLVERSEVPIDERVIAECIKQLQAAEEALKMDKED